MAVAGQALCGAGRPTCDQSVQYMMAVAEYAYYPQLSKPNAQCAPIHSSQQRYFFADSNQISASQIDPSYYHQSQPNAQQPKQSPEYLCLHEPCASNLTGFARKADLERHVRVKHNRASLQLVDCQHPGCHRIGLSGFTRTDKMVEHMREVHKAPIPKRPSNKGSPSSSS